jgi:hypothetical protein
MKGKRMYKILAVLLLGCLVGCKVSDPVVSTSSNDTTPEIAQKLISGTWHGSNELTFTNHLTINGQMVGYKFYREGETEYKLLVDSGENVNDRFSFEINPYSLVLIYEGKTKDNWGDYSVKEEWRQIAGSYSRSNQAPTTEQVVFTSTDQSGLEEKLQVYQTNLEKLEVLKSKLAEESQELKTKLAEAGVKKSDDIKTSSQRVLAKELAEIETNRQKVNSSISNCEDKIVRISSMIRRLKRAEELEQVSVSDSEVQALLESLNEELDTSETPVVDAELEDIIDDVLKEEVAEKEVAEKEDESL